MNFYLLTIYTSVLMIFLCSVPNFQYAALVGRPEKADSRQDRHVSARVQSLFQISMGFLKKVAAIDYTLEK